MLVNHNQEQSTVLLQLFGLYSYTLAVTVWSGRAIGAPRAPDLHLEILWSLITGSPASITTCLQKSK